MAREKATAKAITTKKLSRSMQLLLMMLLNDE